MKTLATLLADVHGVFDMLTMHLLIRCRHCPATKPSAPMLGQQLANDWLKRIFAAAEIHQSVFVNFGRMAVLRNLWPLVRRAVLIEVVQSGHSHNGSFQVYKPSTSRTMTVHLPYC